jgi:hypothetical protein
MSPSVSAERIILMMPFPQAPTLGPEVGQLARRHGLVCYDPQSRQVHHPDQATPDGTLRLEAFDGSRAFDPSSSGARAPTFAGLDSRPEPPEGRYALEYREGSARKHYRALADHPDDVAAVFTGFARGDQGWKSARRWTRL